MGPEVTDTAAAEYREGLELRRAVNSLRTRSTYNFWSLYISRFSNEQEKAISQDVIIVCFQPLGVAKLGSCHKRQKPQAPTPQAPIRNRQTRKVANAKGLNRNNLT